MKFILRRQAIKFLDKQPLVIKKRVLTAIAAIPKGDIKELQGFETYKRLRVGTYRIIFDDLGNVIDVIQIGNRGDIYKSL